MPEGDGFGALWGVVIAQARQHILKTQPYQAKAFLDARVAAEDVVYDAALARELGIKTPYLKAIEAGFACRQAI